MTKNVDLHMKALAFTSMQKKMLFNKIKEADFFSNLFTYDLFFDFLSNIWPIDSMPSSDARFKSMRGNIRQHMINNNDWDLDYLFSEEIPLYKDSSVFESFIVETVKPEYHDRETQRSLVSVINEFLIPKGFILKAEGVETEGMFTFIIDRYKNSLNNSNIPENDIPFLIYRNPSGPANVIGNHKAPNEYPSFLLVVDRWDDFGMESRFELFFYNSETEKAYIGPLKILNIDSKFPNNQDGKYKVRDLMENRFLDLANEKFCSLGQTQRYYDKIKRIFPQKYMSILWALKDCSIFSVIEDFFRSHFYFNRSLIRDNTAERILREEKYIIENRKMSNMNLFSYEFKPSYADEPIAIEFSFDIDNIFPQRIFAIVGKNGVGKTQLISSLPIAIAMHQEELFAPQTPIYSKIIAVSTSLFDSYDVPQPNPTFNYVHIGFVSGEERIKSLQSIKDLKIILSKEINTIISNGRVKSLKKILEPMFHDDILESIFFQQDGEMIISTDGMLEFFESLSSGEASLLYVFCGIVANIRLDSLILFDEPETHLHPNAITSLMSSIYQLLEEYESYSIICTHSPLVIREMKSSGVRIMDRLDTFPVIRSIGIESLGANISALVDEIFENKDIPKYFKTKIDALIKSGISSDSLLEALESNNRDLGLGLKMYIQQRFLLKDEED